MPKPLQIHSLSQAEKLPKRSEIFSFKVLTFPACNIADKSFQPILLVRVVKSGKRNHSIGSSDVCSFWSLRQRKRQHLPNIFQPLPCRITSTNFKFYPIVVLLKPKNSIRFELKYKQCRPDQTTSLEAS